MAVFLLWLMAQDPLGSAFAEELAAGARSAGCGAEFRLRLDGASPVAVVRGLTGGEDGKELYIQFLKDRYSYTIGRVNEIYGTDVASFTELLTHGFGATDGQRPEVMADDAAFFETMKSQWGRTVAGQCRQPARFRIDGGHLVVEFPRRPVP